MTSRFQFTPRLFFDGCSGPWSPADGARIPVDLASRLEAIEARLSAATPGVWMHENAETREDGSPGNAWGVIVSDNSKIVVLWDFIGERDAEFVAHAKQDVPFLISELRKALERE